MNEEYAELLDESIKLELQVSDLYLVFHEAYPEDTEFWWDLMLEEKNHAALLRSIKGMSQQLDEFPQSIFAPVLKDLKDTNHQISELIKRCRKYPPTRKKALKIALKLENTAGELHYQHFMDDDHDQSISEIFKQLNGDDKDHAQKIKTHLESLDALDD